MIIVLTQPFFFSSEAEKIVGMLQNGIADIIHIRKPQSTIAEMQQLIEQLPHSVYDKIVLHDHHSLALKYNLRGVHLNSRNPQPPANFSGTISISCHSINELEEQKRRPFTYLSLSPIFDSISKKDYKSAFTEHEIEKARQQGIIDYRVMALGGVTFDKVEKVKQMGFGGAMILGDAWR